VGRCMGGRVPKQYLAIGGAPILVRTLRALAKSRALAGLVVVVPGDRVAATRRLLARARVPRVHAVVAGGRERQESVWLGLQAVPAEAELVLVHDGVRPFVSP